MGLDIMRADIIVIKEDIVSLLSVNNLRESFYGMDKRYLGLFFR